MQTEASRAAAKNHELWTFVKPRERRTEKCLIGDALPDGSLAVFAVLRAFSDILN